MKSKEQKRLEAKQRQAAYDKLTPVEKAEKSRLWQQRSQCVCIVRSLPGFEGMPFLLKAHTRGCPAREAQTHTN